MAQVTQSQRRVTVQLSNAELNVLLIQPAKDRGFIDFDPTRVQVRQERDGFEITFERVTTG